MSRSIPPMSTRCVHLARSFARLMFTAGALACTEHPAEPPGAPASYDLDVEIERTEYSFATDEMVPVVLTNRSDRDVFLLMGEYVVVDRFTRGVWEAATTWFIVDGNGRSFPVPVGGVEREALPLLYLEGQPGTYRFRFQAFSDPEAAELLPLAERVSPPFVVVP